jgi:hypothetical protein
MITGKKGEKKTEGEKKNHLQVPQSSKQEKM